jgi:hypothetical protein
MMAEIPPTILEERAQPTTGSGPAPPLHRAQYIIIQSVSDPGTFVEVLAGEGAPTPSGGYGKWAHIQRPQRTDLTIHEGYAPMTLTVPLLFDAVRENGVREDVEAKIQVLEGLAGRGIDLPTGFTAGFGKPTLVVVYSNTGASANQLVPKPFQTPNLEWAIEDITFDDHPLRDTGAARIRQAATIKLLQFVRDPLFPPEKAKGYTTKTTTHSLNTVQKLVGQHGLVKGPHSRLAEAVKATMKANAHNKKIGSNPEKPLPVGTHIRIPNKYIQEA